MIDSKEDFDRLPEAEPPHLAGVLLAGFILMMFAGASIAGLVKALHWAGVL